MKAERPKLKYLLAALGVAVVLPMLAIAQTTQEGLAAHCDMPMPPGHHGMPDDRFMDGPMPPFLHGLNLSEAQRDAIFKIVYEQMPVMRDKMKQVRKAEEALHELTFSNHYDDAKAKTLAENAADDLAQLSLLRAQGEHEIYAVLTPEQRKQVEEMKSKQDFHHTNDREGRPQAKSRSM